MSRPVERWLETFMCKQYADTFEAYGYKTLQSVSGGVCDCDMTSFPGELMCVDESRVSVVMNLCLSAGVPVRSTPVEGYGSTARAL